MKSKIEMMVQMASATLANCGSTRTAPEPEDFLGSEVFQFGDGMGLTSITTALFYGTAEEVEAT